MKEILIILSLTINSSLLFAQITLSIEGTIVNNTETGTWEGINIQRSVPTTFTYRNNSITSVNTSGYMLQAGDEGTGNTNNNLDGEIITGNKLIWNGSDMTSIAHGVFTGYNLNAVVKYNYLDNVPMAIIRKSNGMTNTSGGVAYNIIKSPNVGVVAKGMNGVSIYNNTFYNDRTISQTWRPFVDIYANDSFSPSIPSTGTKIKNNIFYTKYQTFNISIEATCLSGFESDYNVFYCESGSPLFSYLGSSKTFSQWQAIGYDVHSVIVNPNFINFTDFVPGARLNYGTNLGTTWQTGLSVNAVWGNKDPNTTNQNGTWQVGARIYDANISNDPPILIIKNNATSFSGFIGEIDATGTYDLNNDILTYEWTIPNNISVSSTNTSMIKFLAPVVNPSQIIDFQLKVSDGRAIVTKSIQINIMPYKPELDEARIVNTEASSYQSSDYPKNASDGNLTTKWSAIGDNQWVILKLAESFKISHLEIAFLPGQKYYSCFDIYASKDYLTWEPILTNANSCNFSADIQVFDFPIQKTNTGFVFLKMIGHGNSVNNLINISEFKIFGLRQQNSNTSDTAKRNIIIYPNPARDFFNISIEEPEIEPDIVRINEISGRVVLEDSFKSNTNTVNIPSYLKNGVYVVTLESGSSILYTQKLIIYK